MRTAILPRDRQILAAAQTLFFERGYHAVGINEVAEKAGITGSAVYRYFESKDEILGTLFDEALDALFERISRGNYREGDPLDEVHFLSRTHANFVVSYQEAAMLMIRDESSLAPSYRRRHGRRVGPYVDRWIDCLTRAFPHRMREECATATSACLSLMNSVGHWPPTAREVDDLGQLLAQLARGTYMSLAEPSPASANNSKE